MDLKYNFKLLLICHTHNRQKPPNRIQNRNPCKGSEIRRQGQGWTDTKIYDPGSGKIYSVDIEFKDAKTLKVYGNILGIGKRVYRTRIEE